MGFSWDVYRIGSLAEESDGYTYTLYSQYDALGRVTQSQVALNSQNYTFQYAYNLAGSLTSETYPSGRVVNTTYDTANRPYAVRGTPPGGSQTSYVTQTGYWPHGAPYWQWYGNGIFPVWTYNSRLQPNNVYASINNQDDQWLFLEQLGWSAPNTTTNDNGVLQSAVVYEGGPSTRPQMATFTQSFGYDMANRLTAAIDTNWVRTFHYDPYGNMSVSGNSGAGLNGLTPLWQNNIDPYYASNNQLKSGSYDAAGNQAGMGSLSLWRDAENRQYQTWDSITHQQVNYLCDAEGNRVQKAVAGGATTDYVYDALGQLAAEYTGAGVVSKEYIRLSGQLVAIENAAGSPCQTCYLSYDHLGSVRLVTDQNATVVARHEYLPFGEALDGSAGRTGPGWGTVDPANQRFTGQERDQETGLDFFQARYLGGALGRFTSPDPMNAGADPINPQSWNAYTYVLNNPLVNIDPTGEDCQGNDDGVSCFVDNPPPPPPDPWSPGGALFQLAWDSTAGLVQQSQQFAQQTQQAFDWLSAPRDPGCMTAHTAAGAAAGMTGGAFAGSLFGPADVATVPIAVATGYVGGAAFGRIGGLISCMSGTGGTGSGRDGSATATGLDPDIAKKVNQFEKKSLRDQKSIYENLKGTYQKHLEKYGQSSGQTTGETNRMERELMEMRRVLRARGQLVD